MSVTAAELRTGEGGQWLHLKGDLRLPALAAATRRLERLWQETRPAGLSLEELDQGDSATLALLLQWTEEAKTTGRALPIKGWPPALLELARLYRLDGLLTIQT